MQNVIVDGGLDLATARPATLPGRIRDCLNYEAGWRRGNTRIDGFERYDGQTSPSSTTGWVFDVLTADVSGVFTDPETMTWTNDNATGPAGVLVKTEIVASATRFWLVFRTGQRRPQFGDTITGDESGASFAMNDIDTGTVEDFPTHYGDHASYLEGLDDLATTLRDEVLPVPGGGTIVGLHYHEDQLYAIRDVAQIRVSAGQANTLQPGMYVVNAADQIGEVLEVSEDGQTINIAATIADGFTLGPADTISIALSIRYDLASGIFSKHDDVLFATSTWAGEFGYSDQRDGSLESGTGLGTAVFINPTNNVPTVDLEAINNVSATGQMAVESTLFAYQADVVTVVSSSSQSELATMWRSTDAGWERATSTRSLQFHSGENDPAGAPIADTKVRAGTLADFYSDGGATSVDWSGVFTDVLAPGGGTITASPFADSFGTNHQTDRFYVKGFNVGLLDTDVVTGVEVHVSCQNTNLPGAASIYGQMLGGSSGFGGAVPEGGLANVVMGGNGSDWGAASLSPAFVNDTEFGFTFSAIGSQAPIPVISVDYVELTVHFTYLPGEKLYLYSPATGGDIGYIRVDSTVLTSGAWDGSAEGYFRVTDWSTVVIPIDTQIRTLPSTVPNTPGGVLVALASGNLSVPALPGSLLLGNNNSKYQMISYNFFASEDRNAIYGVNGAGLAFWYDGKTLDFITTGVGATDGTSGGPAAGVPINEDKPRHLAPHENRLALGYIWGEVYLSGPDPLDFSASTGLAASFGFGDKITGLMPAPGKALAVFTESSTNILLGAPTAFGIEALANVDQQIVNPSVGAIEYTVQSMGNSPIFASFRGIETLETMDQYSDFFTAPLTHDVSSWLLERLQTAAGVEATNKSVVNSVVVRNKNQYRLFFADGYLMTLTFMGKERDPQLTIQQYWFQDDRDKYARCFATASGVTSDGRDRAFFSVEERPAGPAPEVFVVGENLDFVYELDRGRSFDGDEIEAFFDLTHYYSQDRQTGGSAPQRAHRFNVFQIHGVCPGTADLHVSRALNYEDLDAPVMGNEPIPFYAGDKPAEDEPKPKYTKGRLNGRGFAVSMHVSHKSKLEFPHTVQMVTFLNDSDLREDK